MSRNDGLTRRYVGILNSSVVELNITVCECASYAMCLAPLKFCFIIFVSSSRGDFALCEYISLRKEVKS